MPERGEGTQLDRVIARPNDLTNVSRAVLRSEQAKRWTKRYRTEVAASSSSLLSTFAAVSSKPVQTSPSQSTGYAVINRLQYPLDSVKTRLQAYITSYLNPR
jgi:solute carrier family 25 carnitine/acylcarnitine transporter 20/29